MGPLIRNGIEPWFIPVSEPWRNGMIENFNDRYQQMFLGKVVMSSQEDLKAGSLVFEHAITAGIATVNSAGRPH